MLVSRAACQPWDGVLLLGGGKEFSRIIVVICNFFLTLWLEKINIVENRTPLYFKMLILEAP